MQWDPDSLDGLIITEDEKRILTALLLNYYQVKTMETDGSNFDKSSMVAAILLHGPPGTGKTYTAESVAEAARLPLYRITSADIGLEAAGVKRNLEMAFHLAGAWKAGEKRWLAQSAIDTDPSR